MNKFKLAQKRNYFKYVLIGLPKPIDTNALTIEELSWWNTILTARTELLEKFNQRSRNLGLNVIEPCWCRKRRKTNCGDEFCEKPKKLNK